MTEAELPLHVMPVCSQGGHLQEILALEPAWDGARRVTWVTLDGPDVRYCLAEREEVLYAYGPTERSVKNLLKNLPLALRIVHRYRPDVMVSAGSGVAVPFFLAARLLGVRTVYVESLTRTHKLSLTGRIIYRLADTFMVQWPTAVRGHAVYHGGVL